VDVEALDGFSKAFARHLFAAHPEWRAFARTEEGVDGGGEYLVVEVPPQEGTDLAGPLLVHTDNGEVTIGFDHYHAHFDWPPERKAPPAWAEPMAFIAAILSDDLAAASGWDGDRRSGSWLVERGQVPAPPRTFRRVTRVRVRSWRGGLDSDHELRGAWPGS